MAAMHIIFLIFSLAAFSHIAHSHNITEILSGFPDYSIFNDYLTKTKLADEINTRQTITVLVLNNATAAALATLPISAAKDVLSVHVLLDYFDKTTITEVGTKQATSLYQVTGKAVNNNGFVNVTDFKRGKFGFGTQAVAGSAANSSLVKEVKLFPYDIAVLEISKPIIPPGLVEAAGPKASDVNITETLQKAGCGTLAGLIVKTGLQAAFPEAVKKGLTIFAPSDAAFKAPGLPDLNKLTTDQVVALLKYHVVGDYTTIGNLKAKNGSFSTLASDGNGRYTLNATYFGDQITLNAGEDKSRIEGTVIDATPLVIFKIDNILIPSELSEKSPPPASGDSPAPSPRSSPPAPRAGYSPPAPSPKSSSPGDESAGVPASAPSTSAAGDAKLSGFVKTLIAMSAMITLSTLSFH